MTHGNHVGNYKQRKVIIEKNLQGSDRLGTAHRISLAPKRFQISPRVAAVYKASSNFAHLAKRTYSSSVISRFMQRVTSNERDILRTMYLQGLSDAELS